MGKGSTGKREGLKGSRWGKHSTSHKGHENIVGRAWNIPCIPSLIVISLFGHGPYTHGPSPKDHHAFDITTAVPLLAERS